jgi:hypothetical protein
MKTERDYGSTRRYRIESLHQLRLMADRFDPVDIGIQLGSEGNVVSRMLLQYRRNRNGRHWWMHSLSHSSERYYTEPQLRRETRIIEGIEKGALFVELDMSERNDF